MSNDFYILNLKTVTNFTKTTKIFLQELLQSLLTHSHSIPFIRRTVYFIHLIPLSNSGGICESINTFLWIKNTQFLFHFTAFFYFTKFASIRFFLRWTIYELYFNRLMMIALEISTLRRPSSIDRINNEDSKLLSILQSMSIDLGEFLMNICFVLHID